jgi:hypothetical protein
MRDAAMAGQVRDGKPSTLNFQPSTSKEPGRCPALLTHQNPPFLLRPRSPMLDTAARKPHFLVIVF